MNNKKFENIVLPFIKRIDSYIRAYRTSGRYDMIDKILDIKGKILDEAFLEGNEELDFNTVIEKYIPNYFGKTDVAKKKEEEKK